MEYYIVHRRRHIYPQCRCISGLHHSRLGSDGTGKARQSICQWLVRAYGMNMISETRRTFCHTNPATCIFQHVTHASDRATVSLFRTEPGGMYDSTILLFCLQTDSTPYTPGQRKEGRGYRTLLFKHKNTTRIVCTPQRRCRAIGKVHAPTSH